MVLHCGFLKSAFCQHGLIYYFQLNPHIYSVDIFCYESEVAQSCPTLCDPMDCSPSGPPSMGFSRQEYWGGLPFPTSEDLPDPGIKPVSSCISCISWWILYHCTTWGTLFIPIIASKPCLPFISSFAKNTFSYYPWLFLLFGSLGSLLHTVFHDVS